MRGDADRIEDMLATIEKVSRYAREGRQRFDVDELVQVYFLHQLMVLGEAASRVSQELRQRHPGVPWGRMIGMRNTLVRGYLSIDLDIVWGVVETDLPPLTVQLQRIPA